MTIQPKQVAQPMRVLKQTRMNFRDLTPLQIEEKKAQLREKQRGFYGLVKLPSLADYKWMQEMPHHTFRFVLSPNHLIQTAQSIGYDQKPNYTPLDDASKAIQKAVEAMALEQGPKFSYPFNTHLVVNVNLEKAFKMGEGNLVLVVGYRIGGNPDGDRAQIYSRDDSQNDEKLKEGLIVIGTSYESRNAATAAYNFLQRLGFKNGNVFISVADQRTGVKPPTKAELVEKIDALQAELTAGKREIERINGKLEASEARYKELSEFVRDMRENLVAYNGAVKKMRELISSAVSELITAGFFSWKHAVATARAHLTDASQIKVPGDND
jgi:hypothetical protein